MKRYDIHFARLDPVQGAEMGKTRPVVMNKMYDNVDLIKV